MFKFKFFLFLAIGLNFSTNFAQEIQSPKQIAPINGGVINGKARSLPVPAYPQAAKAARADGAVNVQVLIDENGDVISATATSGHPLLRAAAVDAAKQAKFLPTTLSAQPVKVNGVIVYNFVAGEIKLALAAFARNLTLTQRFKWNRGVAENLEKVTLVTLKEFAIEQSQLITLAKTGGVNKVEVINNVLNSLESKLLENDVWQIKLGRILGAVEFDVRNQIVDSKVQIDEPNLRDNLQKINNLVYLAPVETPSETIEILKKLANFANQTNLKSPESLIEIMQTYTDFLKAVSPNNYK